LSSVADRVAVCGSGIRCPFDPGIRDGQKIQIQIRDENTGSYFRELRNNFWVKILKIFDADSHPGIRNLFDPGSGTKKFGSGIRDKHPEFAILLVRVGTM
jgi:hypothetical protein